MRFPPALRSFADDWARARETGVTFHYCETLDFCIALFFSYIVNSLDTGPGDCGMTFHCNRCVCVCVCVRARARIVLCVKKTLRGA